MTSTTYQTLGAFAVGLILVGVTAFYADPGTHDPESSPPVSEEPDLTMGDWQWIALWDSMPPPTPIETVDATPYEPEPPSEQPEPSLEQPEPAPNETVMPPQEVAEASPDGGRRHRRILLGPPTPSGPNSAPLPRPGDSLGHLPETGEAHTAGETADYDTDAADPATDPADLATDPADPAFHTTMNARMRARARRLGRRWRGGSR